MKNQMECTLGVDTAAVGDRIDVFERISSTRYVRVDPVDLALVFEYVKEYLEEKINCFYN